MVRGPRRLSAQILAFQLLILAGALLVGFALALHAAQARLDDDYEARALGVARSVAATPEVAGAVAAADRSGVVQTRAEAVRRATRTAFVVVTDDRGIRYSHPNAARIGERVSTDPAALSGRTVLAVERGTLGRSARAKVPLRGADGRIVGQVSVGILEQALHHELLALIPGFVLYMGIALALGVTASLLLARRLKRQTFGLELDEIAGLLQEREAMLHGIREGVVIVDPRGRLLLVNDEARRLAGLPSDAVERSAEDVVGPGRLADLLVGRVDGADQILVRDEHVIVANRRAVVRDGRELGAIVTLRDRTELEALLRELDSVRGLTDAMRAQAHEFSNRLHTLAGLLALGHHEAAREFIAEVTEADTELRRDLVERIADEHVAALLLAKWAVAAERGVELRLAPDARLDSELVDAREALTVLGNLVDNALDAASAGARRPGLVEVFLGEEGSALVVRVRDSGPGVALAKRDRVFEPGYSTKPGEGRGVGLSLVDQLVERRGGRIEVGDANDEDGGAVFTVWLPESVRGAQVVTL
jgi:two-component system CitB family sensor kinase